MSYFSSTFSRRSYKHICRYSSTLGGDGGLQAVDTSFKKLGVPASVAATLRAAFPEIHSPTEIQRQLIPAILGGKDVLLRDRTGTGKSFGLILALLSDFRVWRSAHESHKTPEDPSISSLVIVPHRDLAYQLSYWIQLFVEHKIQAQRPRLPSIVQVLVRSSTVSLETQLDGLKSVTPHILIGTPQVLLENYNHLKLHKLDCVVVDEVDYLIETVPNSPDKYKMEKLKKKIQKHPGPTRELLNLVLAPRIKVPGGEKPSSHKPQLVLSSATLRSHLNRFLFQESGWLMRGHQHLLKVRGGGDPTMPMHGSTKVSHSVLVVSQNGEIKNTEGSVALAVEGNSREPDAAATETPEALDVGLADPKLGLTAVTPIDSEDYEEGYPTPPPWNPASLEAISICFALEVPRVALLVLPSSAPVQRVIHELRKLEVNAQGLDLLTPVAGRSYLLRSHDSEAAELPSLLVATLASTRGIDMPELSHVFILGIPEGKIDGYLHAAGRTGRFGKAGKVITVVERKEEGAGEDNKAGTDEEKKMKGMFSQMGIKPIKIDHFD